MKTNEELNAIREEVEALRSKLTELNEDELAQVAGGTAPLQTLIPIIFLSGYMWPGKEQDQQIIS